MKHPYLLLWCLALLILGVGCSRRVLVPIEPLALRVPAYHLAPVTSRPAAPLPGQLAGIPIQPAAPAVPVAPTAADFYEPAYQELAKMLDERYPLSFKRAVFVTENAYFDNCLSYEEFSQQIMGLATVCRLLKETNNSYFLYDRDDKENVARNAAIFLMMKDSTRLRKGNTLPPFRYDFEDFDGDADWRKMFVSKLLVTHKGNCHSLPYLYKILADETGAQTWLSLAPNHVYLKQHNKKDGWYNTELTSYTFPIDAWLTASGYISRETIISGIYMDTLTAKQNVVLCLVDLAKGYERKVGRVAAEPFVSKCAALALQHFPHYINAQLLQAESLRHKFERQTATPEAQQVYAAMEAAYTRIFDTGYREMPPQMYADWLRSVNDEKQKYLKKP
ncbi:hypothetical protein SAMN02745146_0348 [Hymenobacter daecheongensis DSM 21074]|uniref:Lipoprotein n=1 Tax=Hymenobacter daecheongensis DSM 21074 TaxID=1121955 RepID=A0A1M6MP79_9BACT|nr:hypothetical protein [Hymenobacter daecheongensis]SHJ85206.1 hypothetical protein SAMN02745146_0348 [Hymenobacter daecheongensis DSM 21074]